MLGADCWLRYSFHHHVAGTRQVQQVQQVQQMKQSGLQELAALAALRKWSGIQIDQRMGYASMGNAMVDA